MIWKIGNLSESWDAGNGAALDGDIDAPAALVMAYYQFGDEKYKEDAKKLIQAMKKSEFWSKTAYEANMNLYEISSGEVNTGLVDDWTDKNGKSEDDYYSYDSSCAPWRTRRLFAGMATIVRLR